MTLVYFWLRLKAWPFLKKYFWQILLGVSSVLTFIFYLLSRRSPPAPIVVPAPSDAGKVVHDLNAVEKEHGAALEAIEVDKRKQVSEAAAEQREESKTLQAGTPSELGKWIDKLS